MSQKFKVGEAVIGQGFTRRAEWNGVEGVIREYHGFRLCEDSHTGKALGRKHVYTVEFSTGDMGRVMQERLRKKRPPRREIDTVVSWEDCAWSPMTVKLDAAIKSAKEAA